MGARISNFKNRQLLNTRIDSGEIDDYFEGLSTNDIKILSEALNSDDFTTIENILVSNLTSYGRDFEEVINKAYDAQIEDLALRFIRKFINELSIRVRNAVERQDLGELEDLRENVDFEFPEGFRRISSNLISQIDNTLKRIGIPKRIEDLVKDLVEEKKKKIELVRKSGVYEKFGRGKKPALVLFGKKGFYSWKTISKEDFLKFKPRKREIPKFEEVNGSKAKTVKEFREDRRGKPLNFKEKMFIDNRKNEDFEQIFMEYVTKFGEIRSKSELKRLISGRK